MMYDGASRYPTPPDPGIPPVHVPVLGALINKRNGHVLQVLSVTP